MDCKTKKLPGQSSFLPPVKVVDEWPNLYPSNWKGAIVEEAFAHPAKYSNKLIRKIYDHLAEEGWVHPGDRVIDPFGGVALGALDAMRHGLSWVGVELEKRFVVWGNMNITLWNKKFSALPKWSGKAILLPGDSRKLAEVMGRFGFDVALSSPPYADLDPRKFVDFGPNLEKMYEAHKKSGGGQTYEQFCATQMKHSAGYAAAVSSPPFSDTLSRDNLSSEDRHALAEEKGITNTEHISPIDLEREGKRSQEDYGTSTAQLGGMKATKKGFEASISSPPFLAQTGGTNVTQESGPLADPAVFKRHAAGNSAIGYGESEGNIGSVDPDDFWIAARQIVEQVFMILEPGGHAVWVVKDYVKNKQRVPFCQQWQQMCEAVGFVTLHEHHALLVRHQEVTKTDMFTGEVTSEAKSSKSFFRRIAEKRSAHLNYWLTLSKRKQSDYLERAKRELEDAYNSLSEEELKLTRKNTKELLHTPPTDRKILDRARSLAFERSGQQVADHNQDTRIDFEVVLCMEKPLQ